MSRREPLAAHAGFGVRGQQGLTDFRCLQLRVSSMLRGSGRMIQRATTTTGSLPLSKSLLRMLLKRVSVSRRKVASFLAGTRYQRGHLTAFCRKCSLCFRSTAVSWSGNPAFSIKEIPRDSCSSTRLGTHRYSGDDSQSGRGTQANTYSDGTRPQGASSDTGEGSLDHRRGPKMQPTFSGRARGRRSGVVASLARPGGNLTGINFFSSELAAKRLDLLHDLLPRAVRVAVLVNPADAANTASTLRDVEAAARAIGLQVQVLNTSTSREINAAFENVGRDRPDALFVGPDTFLIARRIQVVQLAAFHRLP